MRSYHVLRAYSQLSIELRIFIYRISFIPTTTPKHGIIFLTFKVKGKLTKTTQPGCGTSVDPCLLDGKVHILSIIWQGIVYNRRDETLKNVYSTIQLILIDKFRSRCVCFWLVRPEKAEFMEQWLQIWVSESGQQFNSLGVWAFQTETP